MLRERSPRTPRLCTGAPRAVPDRGGPECDRAAQEEGAWRKCIQLTRQYVTIFVLFCFFGLVLTNTNAEQYNHYT